jgi:hypothetical protein
MMPAVSNEHDFNNLKAAILPEGITVPATRYRVSPGTDLIANRVHYPVVKIRAGIYAPRLPTKLFIMLTDLAV